MNEDDKMDEEKVPTKGMGIYETVELGLIGVAFSIVYAFGMLRFVTGIAQLFATRGAKIASAVVVLVFAVGIAVAFIGAVSRLIEDKRTK